MRLHENEYFEITHDAQSGILEIDWTERTAAMSDETFKDALQRLAGLAAEHGARSLLVDVTRFRHHVGPELGAWRGAEITPQYNRAGVRRFAYVFAPGADLPPSSEEAPEAYEGEDFATRFFDAEDEARAWVSDI